MRPSKTPVRSRVLAAVVVGLGLLAGGCATDITLEHVLNDDGELSKARLILTANEREAYEAVVRHALEFHRQLAAGGHHEYTALILSEETSPYRATLEIDYDGARSLGIEEPRRARNILTAYGRNPLDGSYFMEYRVSAGAFTVPEEIEKIPVFIRSSFPSPVSKVEPEGAGEVDPSLPSEVHLYHTSLEEIRERGISFRVTSSPLP